MSKPILHMFWIAEYHACPSGEAQGDGTALPQFDPDTGEEHLFSEIDQPQLKRFGWYAFPRNLANKVANAVHNPRLTSYTLDIPPGGALVAHRTTTITFKPSTLSIEHHQADEYVLGIQGGPRMHIYTDGRVELKWQP